MRSQSRKIRGSARSGRTTLVRPAAVSALAVTGVLTAGSASGSPGLVAAPATHPALTAQAVPISTTGLAPARILPFRPHPGRPKSPETAAAQDNSKQIVDTPMQVTGIPAIALATYRNAAQMLSRSEPGCGLGWSLLAGIGRIESGHASGGRTTAVGTTITPILGPALYGSRPGNEVISTGSGGYVRVVGPTRFLPSTWRAYASDGNKSTGPDVAQSSSAASTPAAASAHRRLPRQH